MDALLSFLRAAASDATVIDAMRGLGENLGVYGVIFAVSGATLYAAQHVLAGKTSGNSTNPMVRFVHFMMEGEAEQNNKVQRGACVVHQCRPSSTCVPTTTTCIIIPSLPAPFFLRSFYSVPSFLLPSCLPPSACIWRRQ
jgi:hypothetical protein